MIYDIILNIEKSGIKPRIKVSQYDKTLPQIRATLYSNNQAFNIPSGSTVYISGTKKDNTGFKYECTYSDNVITADITEQMTAFSGDVEVEFTIESSGSRKGTENFILEVEKAALEDDVIISETDIPALQRLSQPASTTQLGVVKVDGTSVTIDADGTLHSSGGGGGAVDSVNGKTGDVVLTASDVGALADNTPIPSDLSDLSDVDTSGVTDGQILKYNSTSGKFLPSNESGGGTSDYTDLTNKPSINGVTLSGNKTSADLGIFAPTITSPTSGQVIKYDGSNWVNGSVSGGSNRNLLDNPWFTVNQRGNSSYSGADIYSLDRWKNGYGVVTVNSGYININNPSGGYSFYQKVPKSIIEVDKVYTISVLTSGNNVVSKSFTASASYQTFEIDTIQGYVMRGMVDGRNSDSWNVGLINSNAWSINIKAIKLELGTESTLALDVAPNYTEELLKCQRYYFPLAKDSNMTYFGEVTLSNSKWISLVNIPLPTEMRATPTFSGSVTGGDSQGTVGSLTNFSIGGKQHILFSGEWGTGFTPTRGFGDVIFTQGAYLSAEL